MEKCLSGLLNCLEQFGERQRRAKHRGQDARSNYIQYVKEKYQTQNINDFGEVSEWLKEHAWKVCVPLSVPRVRIPPSPPPINKPRLGVFLWVVEKEL